MANLFQLGLSPISLGEPGTKPNLWNATTDSTNAQAITAGAVADYVTSGLLRVNDFIFAVVDADGTPTSYTYRVTSTSGGSLVEISLSASYLTVANNLSDLASAATAKTNLGMLRGSLSWTGGSASHAFTITGLTTSHYGSCNITASTNAVTIQKAAISANTLTVTFSGDPGTGTTLSYFYVT